MKWEVIDKVDRRIDVGDYIGVLDVVGDICQVVRVIEVRNNDELYYSTITIEGNSYGETYGFLKTLEKSDFKDGFVKLKLVDLVDDELQFERVYK